MDSKAAAAAPCFRAVRTPTVLAQLSKKKSARIRAHSSAWGPSGKCLRATKTFAPVSFPNRVGADYVLQCVGSFLGAALAAKGRGVSRACFFRDSRKDVGLSI